jgi:iron complex outermembrane recepter protein
VAVASAMCVSTTAGFLTQSALAEEQAMIEEVVVTGSRIKRTSNLDSSTPIFSIGEEAIEYTGSINVYDIINEIPQAGPASINRASTNFSVGASGQNTVDLRGLGAERTLVLVNGRRWIGGVSGTNIVDLNSIPTDLIESMEVSTGGASAVYGSDAVAGVVNVILKKDFEGVSFEAMTGAYNEGDGDTELYSLTVGGNFADGRGNAIINMRYDEQGGVFAKDRAPNTGTDTFYYGYYYGGAYGAPYDSLIQKPAYSSYPPQGRYFVSGKTSDSTGMLTFDCSERNEFRVLESDTVASWSGQGGSTACGFNRTHFRMLEVPIDRKSVYSNITYELNDNHTLKTDISFVSVETQSNLEPFPMNSEDVFGGDGTLGYHHTNPYVPQEIAEAAILANADNDDWNGNIPFIRRLLEVGGRGASNTRETFRVAIGTEGTLGSTGDGRSIDYDWYYQYGKSERDQRSAGQFNALAFQSALDATTDANGNIICANDAARAAGCVPIDVFGVNSITPAMAEWIRYRPSRQTTMEQSVFAVNFTSSFNLGSLEVSWAAGAEHREEESSDVPDDLQQLGLHGGNRIPETNGDYDVTGYYLEFLVPLISGKTLIEDLSFETAYRTDDYSTTGTVDGFKVGLSWSLNEQFRFRSVYAESARSPNIDDLFAGQAQTFQSISDPCAGVGSAAEPNMDPVVVTNCLSIPDIAATAAAGTLNPDTGLIQPGFQYSQPDTQTISGFIGGNQNLSEETAETLTVGLVWTPPYLENLSLTLDYYDIEIEDVISSVSASRLINECYESTSFPDIEQCGAHERFPGTGKLRYWYSYGINQSRLETDGFDLAVNYLFDDLVIIPGTLNANLLYTRRDQHVEQTTASSDKVDYVGEVGYNEDKIKFKLLYNWDNLTVSVDTTYFSSGLDDATQDKNDYSLNSVDSITYVDIQARYEFNDTYEFYLGLDNVTDEDPPFCPSCNNEPGPGSHYTGLQYRIWDSRFWYAGMKFSM